MKFSREETELLIEVVGMFAEAHDDPKAQLMLATISDKLVCHKKYRINTSLSDRKRARCIELIKMATGYIHEYSAMAGDMSMINEYDSMKKKSAVVMDALGDIEGQLRCGQEIAKRELDAIFERVKDDLIEEEIAKTNTDADRKARSDSRYLCALEDFRKYTEMAYVVRNKLKVLGDVHDDLRQSVSTARNSIIKEGYTQ